jgi:hypothetical protein
MKPTGLYLLMGLAVIWTVTALDCWCCQWLTPDLELNPMAGWVLVHYGVWTLVAAKIVGTFVVTEAVRRLHYGYLTFIALFQTGLALFLTYAP